MQTLTILKQLDFFEGLTNVQLEIIASICQERHCWIEEMIFDENSASDELYIIARGTVDIQVDPSLVGRQRSDEKSQLVTIATLNSGQIFGEVALVDQGLRSAAARCAANNTHLLIIPRDKLMLLCTSFPELGFRLMYNLAAELAMKIRDTDLAIREQLLWNPSRP